MTNTGHSYRRPALRVLTLLFLLFGVLQFVVMWVSFLEPIANR